MNSRSRTVWIIVAIVLAIVAIALIVYYAPINGSSKADEAAVRADVTTFGNYLKDVPLSATSTDALKQDITQAYTQFVTPELLTAWITAPKQAPGRQTSSPWPERIEITNVAHQGQSYIVSGNIILMTSTGEAGKTPVVMQLIKENDKWLIAVYQEQKQQTQTATSTKH
jgi:hypothetical protein